MSKNIISVSGGHGFIGKYIIRKLVSLGYEVYLIDEDDFKSIHTLKDKIINCNVVIHLAGLNKGSSLKLLITNIVLSLKLLEAIRRSGCKNFTIIFPSSFAVYKQNSSHLLTEKSLTFPRNSYGLSKLIIEKIIYVYCVLFGLKGVILRISNVYGPDSKINHSSVVANFINAIYKNESITVNGGNQIRDFIFVDDVSEAFLKVIKSNIKNYEVINICSGEETRIKKLANMLIKISNKQIKIKFNKENVISDKFVGSNTKSNKVLSWKPRVTLQKGLELTYSTWKIQ